MSREKEAFIDNLEMLNAKFPDKELLYVSEIQKALGIPRAQVERIVRGKLIGGRYISKASLARLIS